MTISGRGRCSSASTKVSPHPGSALARRAATCRLATSSSKRPPTRPLAPMIATLMTLAAPARAVASALNPKIVPAFPVIVHSQFQWMYRRLDVHIKTQSHDRVKRPPGCVGRCPRNADLHRTGGSVTMHTVAASADRKMHTIAFIHDLAFIMLAAGVVTVVFHLLHQPVVLGYIVAGVLIGPHTMAYASLVTDETTIQTLAELGIVFLLFSLGLEFSVRRLRQIGATALIAALAGIVLMFWAGYEIGLGFGWHAMDALFLGAMLSISSTTITIKALDELGLKREYFAQVVFAILIVEDVLAIGMIALLSGIAVTGQVDAGAVLHMLAMLTVFLVASLVIGILSVPRLLDFIARFNRNEMLLVAVLGLLFGFCLLVARLGYSIALGAFVIGVIIAEAVCLKRIARVIAPVRDMFSAIFFVAIGLLLDPRTLLDYALPIAVVTLVLVVGKVLARSAGAFAAGQSGRSALRVGMSLAQIGEFSFIIATLGTTLKVTSDFLYPIAVAVSAITTLLTPYLIRAADPLASRLRLMLPSGFRRILLLYTE